MSQQGERPGPGGAGPFGLYGADGRPLNRAASACPSGGGTGASTSASNGARAHGSSASMSQGPGGMEREPGEARRAAPVLMHPSNAALLHYWHLTRGQGVLPLWSNVDLIELTAYLSNLMLLEWTRTDQLLCRFAGPTLVDWIGRDPTNQNLKTLGGLAQCRALIPALCGETLALIKVAYETVSGARVVTEDLCMPISSPGRPVSHVLIGSQLIQGTLAPNAPAPDKPVDRLRPETFSATGRIRLPLDRVERGAPLVYALKASRAAQQTDKSPS